jgi:sterol desaturase/sphingolipid hydroxylase (fatty acid hydroxylase superfamily)
VLFFLSAPVCWHWVVPPVEVMHSLAWAWVLKLFVVNAVAVILWFGAFDFQLYVRRSQANRVKYNSKFPSERPSDVLWFKRQNIDNFLRVVQPIPSARVRLRSSSVLQIQL